MSTSNTTRQRRSKHTKSKPNKNPTHNNDTSNTSSNEASDEKLLNFLKQLREKEVQMKTLHVMWHGHLKRIGFLVCLLAMHQLWKRVLYLKDTLDLVPENTEILDVIFMVKTEFVGVFLSFALAAFLSENNDKLQAAQRMGESDTFWFSTGIAIVQIFCMVGDRFNLWEEMKCGRVVEMLLVRLGIKKRQWLLCILLLQFYALPI
mmetsp:Transcript_24696/g.38195  ORF Transcript_24696/g.38195 Transcript_24696/m.38195 type:complete len:205 (+) Transcript_24696:225-839(+)